MAHQCYLSIKGSKQGSFRGGAPRHGDPGLNWIGVLKIIHEGVGHPDQAGTLDPRAIREGAPISVVVEVGHVSPQIWQALATNEVLTNVTSQFNRPSADGQEQNYYTIELTNCTVDSYHLYHGIPRREAEVYSSASYYHLSFKYQRFTAAYVHF